MTAMDGIDPERKLATFDPQAYVPQSGAGQPSVLPLTVTFMRLPPCSPLFSG